MRRVIALPAVILGLLLGLLAAAPAGAAPAGTSEPAALQSGVVVLYEQTNFTGPVRSILYASCATPTWVLLTRPVGSYDNRPASGCQLALVTAAREHVLCAGRRLVPVAFRNAPQLVIRPGTTPTFCVGAAATAG